MKYLLLLLPLIFTSCAKEQPKSGLCDNRLAYNEVADDIDRQIFPPIIEPHIPNKDDFERHRKESEEERYKPRDENGNELS